MDQVAQARQDIRLGDHRLVCADCLTALPTLPPESVDVIVTSPPYNLGVAYRNYEDRLAEQDYLDWLLQVCKELRRTMRQATRTGGEPVRIARRAVRTRQRRLVVLCDISGSMEPYARAILQLMYVASRSSAAAGGGGSGFSGPSGSGGPGPRRALRSSRFIRPSRSRSRTAIARLRWLRFPTAAMPCWDGRPCR